MSSSGNISSLTGPGSRLAPEISIAWEDVVIELAVVGGGEEGDYSLHISSVTIEDDAK